MAKAFYKGTTLYHPGPNMTIAQCAAMHNVTGYTELADDTAIAAWVAANHPPVAPPTSDITYGTAAMTPGTSNLATGKIYCQYT